MLTILSPAKKLSKECFVKTDLYQSPQFLKESKGLIKVLKKNDSFRSHVINGDK